MAATTLHMKRYIFCDVPNSVDIATLSYLIVTVAEIFEPWVSFNPPNLLLEIMLLKTPRRNYECSVLIAVGMNNAEGITVADDISSWGYSLCHCSEE